MLSRLRNNVNDLMGTIGIIKSDHKKLRAAITEEDEEKAINLWQGNDSSDGRSKKSKPVIDPSEPFPNNDPKKAGDTTPMHLASEHAMQKLCTAFLAAGGNPNTLNAGLQTCLHTLCSSPLQFATRMEMMNMFLSWRGQENESGNKDSLSVNRVDAEGNAAIHYAAENGLAQLVQGLVSAGAIISIVNKNQKTCCELAESSGFYQLSSMLELALVFQPADEGMEAFERAQRSAIATQMSIYCLDCRSFGINDLENYMSKLIDSAVESLGQSPERAETLLTAYDWDMDTLLSEYINNPNIVLQKANLSSEVFLPKLLAPRIESERAEDATEAAEAVAPSKEILAAASHVDIPGRNLLDLDACTDLALLKAEEVRLRAENDVAAAVLASMRIEALELAATNSVIAVNDSISINKISDGNLETLVVAQPLKLPLRVEGERAIADANAFTAVKDSVLCMICCEPMEREANFDIAMQQASALLESGKEEHELCIARSSDGLGLTCRAGHMFCVSCWSQHVTTKVRDEGHSSLACPAFKCGETLNKKWAPFLLMEPELSRVDAIDPVNVSPAKVSENAIAGSLLSRFRRARIIHFVDCNRSCQNCQTPGCGLTLLLPGSRTLHPRARNALEPLPQIAFCAAGHTLCTLCNKEGHAPCSCAEWDRWCKVVNAELAGAVGNSRPNAKKGSSTEVANDLWLHANTKKCPRCSTPIEKDEGCNHMVCGKCRHEFCWMCMEKWSLHSNATGGYFQCNKFVEKESADGEDWMKYTSNLEKGSSRAEAVRLQLSGRRMARFIHHYTRFSAHADSAQREFAMRLETLQRIEYSLARTSHGDLPWLYEGRLENPANVDVHRKFSWSPAHKRRDSESDSRRPHDVEASASSTIPSQSHSPSRQSLSSTVSKAANALSRWFSPSKNRNNEPKSKYRKERSSNAVSDADAAYASENFSTTGEGNEDKDRILGRADGPSCLSFLLAGFDELARARQFLRGTYAYAYFAFDTYIERRSYRLQARLADMQTIYDALQGELEILVEMLSDVLARRRLRASQFQISQLTESVRAKRIEMEESVLNSILGGKEPEGRRVPTGMTSLSANGSLPRDLRRPGAGNSAGNADASQSLFQDLASDADFSRGRLSDEELMAMVSIISQLQHSEAHANTAERAEIRELVSQSLEVLVEHGYINPDIGKDLSNNDTSMSASSTRAAGAAPGRGNLALPPAPPSERAKVKRSGSGAEIRSGRTSQLKDPSQIPPLVPMQQTAIRSGSTSRGNQSRDDGSSSEDEHTARPIRTRTNPSPAKIGMKASSIPAATSAMTQQISGMTGADKDATGMAGFGYVSPQVAKLRNALASDLMNEPTEEELALQNALLMSLREEPVYQASETLPSEENIDLLVQMMNVPAERARQALMRSGHNLEAAINSLLTESPA